MPMPYRVLLHTHAAQFIGYRSHEMGSADVCALSTELTSISVQKYAETSGNARSNFYFLEMQSCNCKTKVYVLTRWTSLRTF